MVIKATPKRSDQLDKLSNPLSPATQSPSTETDTSPSDVNGDADIEKLEAQRTVSDNNALRQRVSRVRSLLGESNQFTHPLSYIKTAEDCIVDFDVGDIFVL